MNELISIIVPVYNSERYLNRCIKSILAQSYNNFELVLVDDGSTDKSGEICDAFALMDWRVLVIHKANGGHTSARKAGLHICRGKYITFVDSDDWLNSSFLMDMIASSQNADVVICGFTSISPDGRQVRKLNTIPSNIYDDSNKNILIEHMIYSGDFYKEGILPALWGKLYKRELIMPDLDAVDESITMGEDSACCYVTIADAKRIVVDNGNFGYCYRISESSITNTYDPCFFDKMQVLYDYLTCAFCERGLLNVVDQIPYYGVRMAIYGFEFEVSVASKNNIIKRYIRLSKDAAYKWVTDSFSNASTESMPEELFPYQKTIVSRHYHKFAIRYMIRKILKKITQ